MRFVCVHGINTEPTDEVAPRWQHLLRGGGLDDAECVDARWTSTGWFSLDVARFTLAAVLEDAGARPIFKRKAIYDVTSGIRRAVRDDPSTIVLAHSMGCPLALMALRTLILEGLAPRAVFFGSPFGHPLWMMWLRAQGFDVMPPCEVLHVYNNDDPIVTWESFEPVLPSWMRSVRIAVPSNAVPAWMWEHDASLYLPHPVMVGELESMR